MPVDGEARRAVLVARRQLIQNLPDDGEQLRDAGTGEGRDPASRRVRQEGAGDLLADLFLDDVEPVGFGQIV